MNIRTFTLVIALFFTINAVFAATTFSGSGNHIDQRAIISNGFSLANEDTVCSTATVFPISGPISINNGTLRLAEDTMLSSSATIATGGRIEGNAKQLSIARRIAPVQFPENTSYAGVINSYTKRFGYRVGAFGCAKKHHDEGTLCAAVAYGEAATTLDVFTMSNGGFAPRASMQIGGGSRCLVWSPNQYDGLCGIQGQSGLLHFSLDDSLSNIRAKNYSFDALTSEVAAIAWHPSGEYALIAQVNERSPFLLLKRTNDGFILKATYEGIVGPITTIGWSPDGTMCAIGTVANSSGKELAFFSFDDDSGLTLVKNYSVGAHVSWISWRPNESECWVALVGNSLSACLQSFSWTEGSGDPEVKKYAIKKSVYDVVWNKDGNLLALTTELDQTRGEVGVYQLRGNRLERANATVYDSKQFTACWSMQENVVYTVDNYGNIMMSEVAAGMQLDNITIASQSSLSLAAANCIERDVAFAGDGVTISTLVPDPFYLKEGAALLFHDCVFTPKHENTVIEAMPNAEVIINNGAILPASKLTSHASIVFSGHCRVSGDIYSKSIILRPHTVLELVGDTTFHGPIYADKAATIIGNGYRFNVTDAELLIAPQTTVGLTHVGALVVSEDSIQSTCLSSELVLCQSLLELENDVVLLNGKIRFDGMSSLLISDKLYTPSRGTFVADGAQSLTSFSGAPQIAASGENSNSLFVISDGTYSLNRDIVLSSSLQWKITRDVVIDGRGYDLRMGPGKKPVIIIEPDTTVTFTNISFSQFDPSRIQVKGASRYQFNNDVSICLSGSIDSEFTCVAHGAVTVDGQGYGVSDSVSFVIMPHSQLQLKRIHFTGMHQGSIRMRDESSSLLLSNVECHLNSAVTFSSGSYAIYDNVSISGPYSFSYTSPGYFSLNKGATLAFRSGAEFHFCPEVDGDMCPFRALDSHCTLELDNASCRVEKSSFSVQKGRLKLHGSVELNGGGLGFIWGDEHFPNMSSIVYGPTLDLTISGLVVCNNGA